MSADTEALLATVREALELIEEWLPPMGMTSIPEEPIKPAQANALHKAKRDIRAALDSLAAELERLQNKLNTDSQNFELEARKAELERLREHDERLSELNFEMAERLDTALAALREIADPTNHHHKPGFIPHEKRARAAIADIEGKA